MFTGIIEEIGVVKSLKRGVHSMCITVTCSKILMDLSIGDSVATNGVCLTVTSKDNGFFTADIMHETIKSSSLASLSVGSHVNLERAMPLNGRFGGHIVSGHIDGTGKISNIKKDDIAIWYTIKANSDILKYIIHKGSITIDGISLTVSKLEKDSFSVSIIPHTASETTLSKKKIGDIVNLENDIIGKYIEKFTSLDKKITKEMLIENGF